MRIAFVLCRYDAADIEPLEFLERTVLPRGLPQAMAARGHRIDCVILFPRSANMLEGGVRYHFDAASPAIRLGARLAARIVQRPQASFEPAPVLGRLLRQLRPDVVHFHGTGVHVNHAIVRRSLSETRAKIVVQHHGGGTARSSVKRRIQRANLRRAARVLFTTAHAASPFIEADMLSREQVEIIMETSTFFQWRPRAEARKRTGLRGDPVFLWTGRLHPIKDPITALQGFARILETRPEAQLYMYYRTAELLGDVRAFLMERPRLRRHVHLYGEAPFGLMEDLYNSADFFLQSSLDEFSGCAALEAMACGAIPVLSDIPSFRAMTSDGRVGILFPRRDADALSCQVLELSRDQAASMASAVQRRFDNALSFSAMAQRLEMVYEEVLCDASAGMVEHHAA